MCTRKRRASGTNGVDMGHTLVTIKVENFTDWVLSQGTKRKKRIRTVVIPDALVDTGTTYLCLPAPYIKELGLKPFPGSVSVTTANGPAERRLFGGALLTLNGRTDQFTVAELPDNVPPLIGVIPLESLDFIVDPTTQTLAGKHGKKRVMLMY
jgi:predicted aspartyl protease